MDNTQNIFKACKNGYLEEVKNLVEQGADIEFRNVFEFKFTPLLMASYYGHIEIVKFLVEKGANLEAKDEHGYTSLIVACDYESLEIVKFLVEKGADIEAKCNNGSTFTNYLNKEQKEIIKKIIYDIQHKKEMIKPCKRYPSGVYPQRGPPKGV